MSPTKRRRSSHPEIWGGIECTVNRVGDQYTDQVQLAGHYSRASDIGDLADLGITSLRYPILWETLEPARNQIIDWTWATRQLDAIRDRGITPVAGLLHHGSGPAYTDLTDPDFASYFAAYAGRVARQFPWLEKYTPVNEPLTTARFSGLYGIWYPHRTNTLDFLQMLLNQVKATVLAMKEIRTVNASAKLIQTEDLSKVHASPGIYYQADFENERRWLTYDLLCGRVVKGHTMWNYLLYSGVREDQLAFFSENPCVPEIIGVNYYITSERYLDENIASYPITDRGGNGIHEYADIAAVRAGKQAGLSVLLREVWDRYRLPIAITEAHMDCTREEQMRWFWEIWNTACAANQSGIDVRGVTSWALLGAYDWNSLLTRKEMHYESGAYELKDGILQLTGVGVLVRELAKNGRFEHVLLKENGWWRREKSPVADGRSSLLLVIREHDQQIDPLVDILARRGLGWQEISHTDSAKIREYREIIELDQPWAILTYGSCDLERVIGHIAGDKGIVHCHIEKKVFCRADASTIIDKMLNLAIDEAMAYMEEDTGSRSIFPNVTNGRVLINH